MKIWILDTATNEKSTLTKKIENLLNIKAYNYETITYDKIKNRKREEIEQRKIINDIIHNKKEWMIEGMMENHLEVLASNTTLIIYIDISKRNIIYQNLKTKISLMSKKIKDNNELQKEIIKNKERSKREVLNKLMKKYPSKLVIIKKKKEIEKLLLAIKDGKELKYQ